MCVCVCVLNPDLDQIYTTLNPDLDQIYTILNQDLDQIYTILNPDLDHMPARFGSDSIADVDQFQNPQL